MKLINYFNLLPDVCILEMQNFMKISVKLRELKPLTFQNHVWFEESSIFKCNIPDWIHLFVLSITSLNLFLRRRFPTFRTFFAVCNQFKNAISSKGFHTPSGWYFVVGNKYSNKYSKHFKQTCGKNIFNFLSSFFFELRIVTEFFLARSYKKIKIK